MKYAFQFILMIVATNPLTAQDIPRDSVRIGFNAYGSFRVHMAYYNDEIEIQENASRIGFELSVYKGKARFFAGAELAINLFKGPVIFNADANTNSGFITVDDPQNRQVFSTRLGYLGADFGKFGTVIIGKQWSVYYDITGYTDKFNVFGGQGSATYVGNSDGGGSGTGRASQSLTYRNNLGNLIVGGQLTMRSAFNDYFFDGFGVSAQYEILHGLKVGTAYNRAYFNQEIIDNSLGAEKQPEYLTFGLSYINDTWDLGVVYSIQNNGDYTEIPVEDELVAAVYDASGLEVFAKFKKPRYSLIAGFNGYDPDVAGLPVDSNFRKQYFVLGAEYKPSRFAYLYSEYRISNSLNQFGEDEFNVFTVGLRIDLDREWTRNINVKE